MPKLKVSKPEHPEDSVSQHAGPILDPATVSLADFSRARSAPLTMGS